MPPSKNPAEGNKPLGIPQDVAAIRQRIRAFLNAPAANGKKVGNARWGVNAFYDYDGEPIYVGQTNEMLRSRISRHLTNQRTDAVAMNVLDPFEVAEIEVWPLWELQHNSSGDADSKAILNSAEYTVFQLVLGKSSFMAVLNEGDIPPAKLMTLPPSMRGCIIPEELYGSANTRTCGLLAVRQPSRRLARVISEREVSKGLRSTLKTQAERLKRLAAQRYGEISGTVPTVEPGEEV